MLGPKRIELRASGLTSFAIGSQEGHSVILQAQRMGHRQQPCWALAEGQEHTEAVVEPAVEGKEQHTEVLAEEQEHTEAEEQLEVAEQGQHTEVVAQEQEHTEAEELPELEEQVEAVEPPEAVDTEPAQQEVLAIEPYCLPVPLSE